MKFFLMFLILSLTVCAVLGKGIKDQGESANAPVEGGHGSSSNSPSKSGQESNSGPGEERANGVKRKVGGAVVDCAVHGIKNHCH